MRMREAFRELKKMAGGRCCSVDYSIMYYPSTERTDVKKQVYIAPLLADGKTWEEAVSNMKKKIVQ